MRLGTSIIAMILLKGTKTYPFPHMVSKKLHWLTDRGPCDHINISSKEEKPLLLTWQQSQKWCWNWHYVVMQLLKVQLVGWPTYKKTIHNIDIKNKPIKDIMVTMKWTPKHGICIVNSNILQKGTHEHYFNLGLQNTISSCLLAMIGNTWPCHHK